MGVGCVCLYNKIYENQYETLGKCIQMGLNMNNVVDNWQNETKGNSKS